MKIVHTNDLLGTSREVDCPKGGFKSLRILLEEDGMGYTLTKTIIPKGVPQKWHYQNHLESCLCIEGVGILTNLNTGRTHLIGPGTTYILDQHDPHTFQALVEVVLVCVFNPPLSGREVHDKNGSYTIKEQKW